MSPLSFFAPQQCILPPRPVGGVSIKHYLLWCGWRTLKIQPRSYDYKFRAVLNLLHPTEYNTVFSRFCYCWLCAHVLYSPSPNKIKEREGLYMYCHALHIFSPFIPYLFFFRSLINHSPGIIVVEQGRDDRGWLDVPQEGRGESQLAVQNHFAPRGRVVHPGGAKSCPNRREPSEGSQRAMDGYITSILLCPSFVTGDHSILQ